MPSGGPLDLMLRCEQTGPVVLRLFDPAGKLVFEKVAEKTSDALREHFDFSSLPPGAYFWQASIGAQSAGLQWVKQ